VSDPIPTKSRIFADRYCRELRRLEQLHAGKLSRGAKTWSDAVLTLANRMLGIESPVKRAAMLAKAIDYLDSIKPEQRAHFVFASHGASRAAGLVFATFSAGLHPFIGVDEEGVTIHQHSIWCDRRCNVEMLNGIDLSHVSKHAISRMHERGHGLTASHASGMLGFCGVLGHLTRYSAKHVMGALSLHFSDTLLVGSLKHSVKHVSDGRGVNGTFYDVRTALPADEVSNADIIDQGRIACHVVAEWFASHDPETDETLADRIPFLPRREDDYTLRAAVRH
jgi:hypothetical protein